MFSDVLASVPATQEQRDAAWSELYNFNTQITKGLLTEGIKRLRLVAARNWSILLFAYPICGAVAIPLVLLLGIIMFEKDSGYSKLEELFERRRQVLDRIESFIPTRECYHIQAPAAFKRTDCSGVNILFYGVCIVLTGVGLLGGTILLLVWMKIHGYLPD